MSSREPTYRCPTCLDSGQVTIWCPETVKVLMGKPTGDAIIPKTVVCACKCDSGDKFRTKTLRNGDTRPYLPTLGSQWWHVVAQWHDHHRDAYADCKDVKLPNHENSFDAWNES